MALYVETLTDNRNRTASEIRTILTKNGGSLAEPGSVAWQFERKGIVIFPSPLDEEAVMEATLEAGAEDLVNEGENWRLTCSPSDLPALREAVEKAQISFESADVTMLASSTVEISDPQEAKAVLKLIDLLDEDDDVQDVYANFDIPDDVLENL